MAEPKPFILTNWRFAIGGSLKIIKSMAINNWRNYRNDIILAIYSGYLTSSSSSEPSPLELSSSSTSESESDSMGDLSSDSDAPSLYLVGALVSRRGRVPVEGPAAARSDASSIAPVIQLLLLPSAVAHTGKNDVKSASDFISD